jgi:hypothetical protein
MLSTYQRVMAAHRRRIVLDDREICTCAHPRADHDHYVADCYRCPCPMFTDQNDWKGATDGND